MNVSLVPPQHPGYRDWCRRQRLRAADNRPRDPIAREYYQQLMGWEAVVQRLLSVSVTECAAERILESEGVWGARIRTKYSELDFVSGSQLDPRVFVEIKLRERTEVVGRTGWNQLRRSLASARTRWPHLGGISVCVAMGRILQTEGQLSVCPVRPDDLRGRLESVRGCDGEVLWLDGRDVADFGVSVRMFTEEDVQLLPELRQDMLYPVRMLDRMRRQEPA
ncbi:MAG: hypothetical protein ACKOEO_22445 [Planctomycetaceae bacterium]